MTPEEVTNAIKEHTEEPSSEPIASSQEVRHISHGYQDDLAQAMNATDASVVQEMLNDAREREIYIKEETKRGHERTWFSISSLTLLCFALVIGGYGLYHYTHLTVPAEKSVSIGAFPSTPPISTETPLSSLKETIVPNTLKEGVPYLVSLIDPSTKALITNKALFSYIHADASEPLMAQFSSIRLGIMRIKENTETFLVGSVKDPVTTTKELLIAEPDMLTLFAEALGIDTTIIAPKTSTAFNGEHYSNLPIRVATYLTLDGSTQNLFYYGFAADTVVVVATEPTILTAISDTIIKQQ